MVQHLNRPPGMPQIPDQQAAVSGVQVEFVDPLPAGTGRCVGMEADVSKFLGPDTESAQIIRALGTSDSDLKEELVEKSLRLIRPIGGGHLQGPTSQYDQCRRQPKTPQRGLLPLKAHVYQEG